jgi:UDPglucose 6-dehydrogenase
LDITFVGNEKHLALKDATAVVILTEWDEFKTYEWQKLRALMAEKATIFDFRCYMDRQLMCDTFDAAFQLGVGWLKK